MSDGEKIAMFVSIIAAACSTLSVIVNIRRNVASDNKKEATEMTTVIVKLETIANGVAEIKSDVRNLKSDIQELRDRLIIVEQSTKSAHHRLDTLDGGKEK